MNHLVYLYLLTFCSIWQGLQSKYSWIDFKDIMCPVILRNTRLDNVFRNPEFLLKVSGKPPL